MKRVLFTLIFLVLVLGTVFAQSSWYTVGTNTVPLGKTGNSPSINFIGTNLYLAYSDSGYSNKVTVKLCYDFTNWLTVGTPGFSLGQANQVNMAYPYVAFQDLTEVNSISLYAFVSNTNYNYTVVYPTNVSTNWSQYGYYVYVTNYASSNGIVSTNIWLPVANRIASNGYVDSTFIQTTNGNLIFAGAGLSNGLKLQAGSITNITNGTWQFLGTNISSGVAGNIGMAGATSNNFFIAFRDYYNYSTFSVLNFSNGSFHRLTNNYFALPVQEIKIKTYNGQPFVMFQNYLPGYLSIATYTNFVITNITYGSTTNTNVSTNNTWTNIIGGANFSTRAMYPDFTISSNGTIFVAYADSTNYENIAVLEYSNNTWTSLGYATTGGWAQDIRLTVNSSNQLGLAYIQNWTTKVKVYK